MESNGERWTINRRLYWLFASEADSKVFLADLRVPIKAGSRRSDIVCRVIHADVVSPSIDLPARFEGAFECRLRLVV